MTELESKSILHQIQTERVENGLVKNCLIQLEKANRLIQSELRKSKGVTTKARYKELRKYLKDVAKELKEQLYASMDIDEFIDYELQAQIKLYKKYGNLNLLAPNKEQLISTATFTPYTPTSTFANFLDSFEYDYFNVWDSTVRTGYLTGLTTQNIIKKVMGYGARDSQVADMGAIHSLRVSVERNTRTALQSFAMETRKMIYEKNSKLFDGYKWVATLDRRSCIICGQLDGKEYPKMEDFGEVPPMHPNCRCTIIPVIKGYEELDEGDTRASMNGEVDGKITFEQWLGEQSAEVQKDVLGEYRYKLFKQGEPMKTFISDNRVLTISELKGKFE